MTGLAVARSRTLLGASVFSISFGLMEGAGFGGDFLSFFINRFATDHVFARRKMNIAVTDGRAREGELGKRGFKFSVGESILSIVVDWIWFRPGRGGVGDRRW